MKISGFHEPYAPFLTERRTRCLVQFYVQEIRGISQKTSEMWGTLSFVQVKALLWLQLERADRRAFLPGLDILDGVVVKDLVVFARDVADMWCCHDIGQGSQWM